MGYYYLIHKFMVVITHPYYFQVCKVLFPLTDGTWGLLLLERPLSFKSFEAKCLQGKHSTIQVVLFIQFARLTFSLGRDKFLHNNAKRIYSTQNFQTDVLSFKQRVTLRRAEIHFEALAVIYLSTERFNQKCFHTQLWFNNVLLWQATFHQFENWIFLDEKAAREIGGKNDLLNWLKIWYFSSSERENMKMIFL